MSSYFLYSSTSSNAWDVYHVNMHGNIISKSSIHKPTNGIIFRFTANASHINIFNALLFTDRYFLLKKKNGIFQFQPFYIYQSVFVNAILWVLFFGCSHHKHSQFEREHDTKAINERKIAMSRIFPYSSEFEHTVFVLVLCIVALGWTNNIRPKLLIFTKNDR